ncbi:MAG TPA: hypothetical protein VHZ74_18240 [Bryobacteraceae bacterium]|jgi:hypothetical protein|nr:hypothetical protein [Bryobacteraceae bacterium]
MGPTTLVDKSFLQSLSVDEAVVFDRFFLSIICPMFYVETLADLEKRVLVAQTPEAEVRIIAQKFPETHGYPCPHYGDLCAASLMGQTVPMTGQIPMLGGRPVKVDDRKGVIFEERPEAEAFRRWQAEEFLEVERRFAKVWRAGRLAVDTLTIAAGLKAMGIDTQTCKTLNDAKVLADKFVAADSMVSDRLKLAVMTLQLPTEAEPFIWEEWQRSGLRPLPEYAPYAAHVLKVELFGHIAVQAGLLKNYDRQDIGYFSYLPFSFVFVSSDKLQRRSAPLFLGKDQRFVWGPELKADLTKIVEQYKNLPQEEQEKGMMKYAHFPPNDTLVATLLNGFGEMMKQREQERLRALFDQPPVEAPPPKNFKPFPTAEPELVKHLNRFRDAPELAPEDVDFDQSNPDILSVQRRVNKRRGSFWQLPKDLKEG